MIPVRVHLNGFMSYREPGEFLFDGAPLWMLAGPNGSGKSTVFDAITFALFGETRAGATNYRELINHACDNLVAEVDFRIGEDTYRVKRTINRRNKSTFQAWHLSGPNPPPGKGVPGEARPIPDAESKTGLESWVREVLGLDRETFSTSVLLRQGKSDALLNAEPRERHRMLAQIVGLKAYENLHKRVVELARDAKGAADYCASKLQSIEPVDENRLSELSRLMEAADAAKHAARLEAEKWSRLLDKCHLWHELQGEYGAIETGLAAARKLIAQAPQIRAEALRFRDLEENLPRLRELWQVRESLAAREAAIAHLQREAESAKGAETGAQKALESARVRHTELLLAQREWQTRGAEASDALSQLAEPLAEWKQLSELRREDEALGKLLQEFDDDLPAQLAALENTAAALQKLQNERPWLEQFVQAREDFKQARADGLRARDEKAQFQTQIDALQPQVAALQNDEFTAANAVNEAREAVGQAKAWRKQIEDGETRLHSVENQPTCSYCGQELTEAHLDDERARLQAEKATAQHALESALTDQKSAENEVVRLKTDREKANSRLTEAQNAFQEAERAFSQAKALKDQAQTRGAAALDRLPQEWRDRIAPGGAAFEQCFKSLCPTPEEMDALRRDEEKHSAAVAQLPSVRKQATEQQKLAAQREALQTRRAPLEAIFPAERVAELKEKFQTARDEKTAAETHLRKVNDDLPRAENSLNSAQNALEAAQTRRQTAEAALAEHNQEISEGRGAAAALEANLPAAWHEAAREITEGRLVLLENEHDSLQCAPERIEELSQAEHDEKSLQTRLAELENKLDDVPREARRAPEEIAATQHAADVAYAEAETQWRGAAEEKARLESDKQQRAQAEADFHVQTHRAQLLKILGEYLGPDKLQRYLLQEAETAIVAHSNQVLDRISNGTLRLELRANAATSSSKEPTALDMVAFNSETSEQPLPVALLSGSQRFRVAVAVALGMGQFASQGTRRIESVIIDEGFGSLDRDGRREMIDELHSLKSVLQRIILVSHQEEFSDAFPNRYAIELRDGASHVTLVDER